MAGRELIAGLPERLPLARGRHSTKRLGQTQAEVLGKGTGHNVRRARLAYDAAS